MCLHNGRYVKVLENAEGKNYTSVVALLRMMRSLLVNLQKTAVTNPENTIFAVKRLIEEIFPTHQLKKILKHLF